MRELILFSLMAYRPLADPLPVGCRRIPGRLAYGTDMGIGEIAGGAVVSADGRRGYTGGKNPYRIA